MVTIYNDQDVKYDATRSIYPLNKAIAIRSAIR